ncbi:PREDICTED: transcription initiation factor TFIID subunit 13 [Nipponia nippon]|nr:PREDICTED: transcription initiation factor TFIID subunit 13 [Nipponia nippon]
MACLACGHRVVPVADTGCWVRDLSTSRTNPERHQGEIATVQPAAVQESSVGCGGCRYLEHKAIDLWSNPPLVYMQLRNPSSCSFAWSQLRLFEEDAEEAGGGLDGGQGKRKRLFSKELRCMMYGFGDDQNPYTESVDILEDLVIEFITEMTHKAMSIGRQGRVQVEDIVFLIRKDPRKFARVKDLLTMNEELKRARKAFDEANYGS